ncbi:helix-turn-helix domain-containing protein [Halalkaliarchaeum sp. AArc-GB]|uniref:winged helix-turn-helix transcriptional regulator n=1 Tax=unclassified Halalkaliarchaeum TaxID=2678344 RepID=UPI00217DDEDD|nr:MULTISPECIES: helix-turn-helix domain-containing protein [unclassified Halalkaliarchaeum]MDR5673680.1 helix-turn-helix domain-containing protein [Halalkaliarchaeum sp. AArc-GB]
MDSDAEFELGLGYTPEKARRLREELAPDERERVEATVARLLGLLGRAHAIAVLSAFAFADGPLRFRDLESSLEVPPNTLSTRLTELSDAGLLSRTAYDEVPPRVEYEPTETARALFPAFGHLHVWALEHELEPETE